MEGIVPQIHNLIEHKFAREQQVKQLKKLIDTLEVCSEVADSALLHVKLLKEKDSHEVATAKEMVPSYNQEMVSRLNSEITGVVDDFDSLKNKERLLRTQFMKKLDELTKEARDFCDYKSEDEMAWKTKENDLLDQIKALSKEKESLTNRLEEHKAEEMAWKTKENKFLDDIKALSKEKEALSKEKESLKNRLIEEHKAKEMAWKTKENDLRDQIKALSKEKESLTNRLIEHKLEEMAWKTKENKHLDRIKVLFDQKQYLIKRVIEERNKGNNSDTDIESLTKKLHGGLSVNDSPMQRWVNTFPTWLQGVVAPKGAVTGDEFGLLMGTLVSLTSYVVSHINKGTKVTAAGGFTTLGHIMMGTMINNIVTHLSAADTTGFKLALLKSITNVPWVLLGGLIPIVLGGWIHPWKIRVLVIGIVTFLVKTMFAGLWTWFYKIPKFRSVLLVILGVVGTILSAGFPEFINWVVEKAKAKKA